MTFDEFFKKATGLKEGPYPFQREFAEAKDLYQLVDVPTGLGKTAMVILGWLWRRFHAREEVRKATPRRLVYCLPMRVLVEQTRENARKWMANLCQAGYLQKDVPVHVLMGGEDQGDWAMWPEREAILIGTQDMLLSRALNRGYAASRARWPMEFGLLHNDCLWVFDEVQLMGSGLATTAQFEAFRRKLPTGNSPQAKDRHGCQSVWMSATMQRDWLKTVDFAPWVDSSTPLELSEEDRKCEEVKKRWEANKLLKPTDAKIGDATSLAERILTVHKRGTRTLVVVNTVRRACELFQALNAGDGGAQNQGRKGKKKREPQDNPTVPGTSKPRIVLLHSRFRPGDRARAFQEVLADPSPEGTIVVSTQVIEAGVDVSATTLFTELAPWASLVQRFGRCNRKGDDNERAVVHWIDLLDEETFKRVHPDKAKGKEGKTKSAKQITEAYQEHIQMLSRPYELDDLKASAEKLTGLMDVGPKSLPKVNLLFKHTHVIRRKDLIDLFDTTADLAGNDIDIDRFIRDVEETDVRVFWRDYGETPNETDGKDAETAPRRKELCPAPVGEFRKFAADARRKGKVWRWDFLEKRWEQADTARIVPGQIYLVDAVAGGYVVDRGWDAQSPKCVEAVTTADGTSAPESNEDDRYSQTATWQTIGEHTERVCSHLDAILHGLSIDSADALQHAARWHDRGKVHDVFVKTLPEGPPTHGNHWAKAPGTWKRYERRHFRHELASALAVLDSTNTQIPDHLRDLIAYLVGAHHGKVRLSIRSMPNEVRPAEGHRFARGIWDDDALPKTDLGGGIVAPAAKLSLEPMELGLCEHEPFKGQPSWAERMIRLRDNLGPFRLAYLEALLRAADWRASRPEDHL